MREMYKNCENIELINSLKWWHLISEKICDGYTHSQEDDDVYNEALEAFLT